MHLYRIDRCTNLHKKSWVESVRSSGREVTAVLVEECPDADQDEREKFHIRRCRHEGHPLTNLSDGGEGGVNPDPSVVAKIKAALRGKKRPPHVVELMRKNGKRYVGEANPNYGKTHGVEARRRISEAKLGKPLTEAHVLKMSMSLRGKNAKITEGTAIAILRRYRAGGVSQQRLADEYGIGQSQVSRIIRGEKRKHLQEVA